MPIFRFKCHSCGREFEDYRNIMQKEETGACILCGSHNIERMRNMNPECDCGCGCSSSDSDPRG